MLSECRAGSIDMIITKSLQRFSRNTVTLLKTVRELKALGVDVYFEEQNIHTLSSDGELMMTIIASYAQEESRSASENQKWRVRKGFEHGELMNWRFMFGYDITAKGIEVNPEEAEIVKEVFERFVGGESLTGICTDLNRRGIQGKLGGVWKGPHIRALLSNEKVTGNALLQKTYVRDHLTKEQKRNNGELPKYYATDTHPAIIDQATFDAAQERLRAIAQTIVDRKAPETSEFTGKILCPFCHKHYKRVTTNGSVGWNCSVFVERGKAYCHGKKIPNTTLKSTLAQVLGIDNFDAAIFEREVDHIEVPKANELIICFRDGREERATWKDRSRACSWTPEMRAKAAEDAKKSRR